MMTSWIEGRNRLRDSELLALSVYLGESRNEFYLNHITSLSKEVIASDGV